MASDRDIDRARSVIYDPDRMKRLKTELSSIELLMNFDPGNASGFGPNDPRVEPGAGPSWFIPATGKLSTSVREAADRCDKVADQLLSTRRRLGDLNIDGSDRQDLRQGFKHLANAWRERGELWRDPDGAKRSSANRIIAEEKQAFQEFKRVKEYFEL